MAVAGKVSDLPLDKPASLLFYLARRGDWVSRSELAFLYRPDAPESVALGNVRVYLHRAKERHWAEQLELKKSRVRFTVETDVAAFEAALAQRAWPEALTLYRGTFLTGMNLHDVPGYDTWLELERQDLTRKWRSAALHYAHELEQQRDLSGAQGWLEQVLHTDPLDEECLQALLRVLYAGGKRAQAQGAYEAFCRNLTRELEVEPLETTKALYESLRQSESEVFTTLPVKPAKHNLPTPTTRFIGRKHELAQLSATLAEPDCRLLTLVGLGGVGKTRLALELASGQLGTFADGVWFVPLAGVGSPDLLVSSIAGAVGLTFSGSSPPQTQLGNFLREKELLLLLDNFEHLLKGAMLLEELLETAPKLKLLLTSRVALELRAESLFDVDGLSYPPSGTQDPLDSFDAVKLFNNRAERLSETFVAQGETLEAVAGLTRKVEGLPLALELAASWTRSLSVPQLLTELDKNLELLSGRLRDLPERHRSLRTVFDYSWQRLTAKEQEALAKLSIFQGGFTLAAAEEIAEVHLALLLSLINHSLVRRTQAGRYLMHELVRQFAANTLKVEAQSAHFISYCQYFSRRLFQKTAALKGPEQVRVAAELEHDVDNIRASWRWALHYEQFPLLSHMAEGLFLLLEIKGLYAEGVEVFGTAAHATRHHSKELNRTLTGQLLAFAGYFNHHLGRHKQAETLLKESLQHLLGTASAAEGFACHSLGAITHSAGDFLKAKAWYVRAIEIYQPMGDTWGVVRATTNLGTLLWDVNRDTQETERVYRQALELAQQEGYLTEIGLLLKNIGIVTEHSEKLEEAFELYKESLALFEKVGYIRGQSAALTNLGHVREHGGNFFEAKNYYEQSIVLKRQLGDPVALAISLTNLADALLALGEEQRARVVNLEALKLCQKAQAHPYSIRVLWSFANYFAQREEKEKALHLAYFIATFQASEVWTRRDAKEAIPSWEKGMSEAQLSDLRSQVSQQELEDIIFRVVNSW